MIKIVVFPYYFVLLLNNQGIQATENKQNIDVDVMQENSFLLLGAHYHVGVINSDCIYYL